MREKRFNYLLILGFLAGLSTIIACVCFIIFKPNISKNMIIGYKRCSKELNNAPQNWVDFLWVISYIWLAMFIGYDYTTFFRTVKIEKKIFLYKFTKYGYLSIISYLLIVIKSVLAIVFFRYSLYGGFFRLTIISLVIAFLANINYILIGVRINKCTKLLSDIDRVPDIWFLRVLGLNGMAFFASWTTFLGLTCMSDILRHSKVPNLVENYGKISIIVYLVLIILMFLMEVIFFDNYFRHSIVYYLCAVITGCSVILECSQYYVGTWPKQYDLQLTIIGCSVALFVLKLIIAIIRDCSGRRPGSLLSIVGTNKKVKS